MSDDKIILDIKNITVAYGEKTVLKNFSLSLTGGEKVILAGPNGSGKTTLLKCILGSVRPESGTVWKAPRLKTAYTRQGDTETISPVSVREVVSMGLYRSHGKDRAYVDMAMEKAGVSHLASRSFSSLSGGERQRVQIARSITQEADIVLMDEPTTFLDTSFRDELADILRLLPDTMAAVVVTHDSVLMEKLGWSIVRLEREEEECRE